jgi:hypothetical protein
MKGNAIFELNKAVVKRHNCFLRLKKTPSPVKKDYSNQGLFNGLVSACKNYKILDKTLILDCYKSKFFDAVYNKFNGFNLISVNAVIKSDSGIILIKRGKKVFSHKGFWDFPAGLIFYKGGFRRRMLNRIAFDTGVGARHIHVDKAPFLVSVSNKVVNLFYKARLNPKFKLSQNDNLKIVSHKNLKKFLAKNRVVYPKVFSYI